MKKDDQAAAEKREQATANKSAKYGGIKQRRQNMGSTIRQSVAETASA